MRIPAVLSAARPVVLSAARPVVLSAARPVVLSAARTVVLSAARTVVLSAAKDLHLTALLLSLATVPVAAQVVTPPAPVVLDSLPSFARPNGALLRPVSLTYQLTLRKPDGQVVPLGTRAVSVSEQSLGGVASWQIVESRTGTVVPTLDSVVVNRADLAPERWVSTIGNAQLAVSFTRDSAFGVVQTYQGRSSFVAPIPPNVLLSASSAERLLEMLPLQEGYRAAATMLVIAGPSPTLLPSEIVVEREEDADVNGRRVRAWRVALRAGAIEARYWVSRDGTRVVRTEQALSEGVLISALLQ